MKTGTLYLLPCPIGGNGSPEDVLPAANVEIMRSLDYFIVENTRSARRFLSSAGIRGIEELEFVELNEHTPFAEIEAMLEPMTKGRNGGVISEAGVPAVADPGADVVAAAHRNGLTVRPLVGPSSILLALMASGANGQSFAFNGYLPIKDPDRGKAIRAFERRATTEKQSQIFIETPYRSDRLFAELVAVCAPDTRLTVAANITAPDEMIVTRTVGEWRKKALPVIGKRPTIFILS